MTKGKELMKSFTSVGCKVSHKAKLCMACSTSCMITISHMPFYIKKFYSSSWWNVLKGADMTSDSVLFKLSVHFHPHIPTQSQDSLSGCNESIVISLHCFKTL